MSVRAAAADRLARLAGTPADRPVPRLPAALAVAAVACQVAYPLLAGAARDACTIATVLLFSGAALTHAAATRGLATAVRVAAVFLGVGLAVEVLGVATGWPFGTYAYSDRLGPMVADVPLLIPLAWSMVGWPALVVARRITAHPLLGPAVGAVALASWDLFLDPQMVAEGYWTWGGDGVRMLGDIPATNYLAWLGTAAVMMALLWPTARRFADDADDRIPVALYLWTWAGSALAHVAFLGLPWSGLYGGVAMGAVVLLLVRRADLAVSAPRRADAVEGARS